MKTIGICSMAAIMMAGFSGCGGKTGGAVSSGAKNAAKIGFTAALTGGAAAYGKSEEEGVRLAVEEINKKGDFPIDLLVEDTKAVPADSMNATKKLIQEKVSMIIGPMTSNEAKAAGPIIQNAKVPSLEISVTAENITDIGDCIFRNSVPESKNIPQTVKKTHKLLGYKTAAILYAHDNEQHVTAQKYFQKTMEEEGVQVIDVETFGSKDSEYSAQLTNIQHKAPDVIVVCSYYQEGSRILKKMREMGMDQPVLGDNGFVSPELGKMAEIENSGTFPPDITIEKLLGGHNSEPQNLIVANVLYKSAVLESWGRGIALMVNECRRVGIPDPEFHTDGNAVWIVFHYTRTTVGQDPTATPQQPYSNPTVTPQLGKLLSAIGNNTLSAKEIMEKTGMKDKRNFLKNYIHPAINSGLVLSLYPIGSKSPQQKYYLTDKGKGFLQQ